MTTTAPAQVITAPYGGRIAAWQATDREQGHATFSYKYPSASAVAGPLGGFILGAGASLFATARVGSPPLAKAGIVASSSIAGTVAGALFGAHRQEGTRYHNAAMTRREFDDEIARGRSPETNEKTAGMVGGMLTGVMASAFVGGRIPAVARNPFAGFGAVVTGAALGGWLGRTIGAAAGD